MIRYEIRMRGVVWGLAWLVLCCLQGYAQVDTTTIVDTIYRADGSPAGGSLLVSWPAFTTGGSQAVPAGKTQVQIASNGGVQFSLAPNAGAMPAGTYYTASYHLNDGTVSTEYWTVPQAAQATIAAIRSSVVPATVAVQSASMSYVEQSIAEAVTGYLPLTGGTLSGPLYLSENPVQSTEAATKQYVDTTLGSINGGIVTKLDVNPIQTQTILQPAGTTLSVSNLQNLEYAGPKQSGAGNNGIANSMGGAECVNGGCLVIADPGYNVAEAPQGEPFPACTGGEPGGGDGDYCGFLWPINSRLWDQRGGTDIFAYQNPINRFGTNLGAYPLNYPGTVAADAATARLSIFDFDTDYGNSQLIPEENLLHQFAGGHNGNYGTGWNKTNVQLASDKVVDFSQGQHAIRPMINICLGLGDCMGSPVQITFASGLSSPSDEGTHRGDQWIHEDNRVFKGICASGCSSGSTALSIHVTSGGGDQGEGRMAIDLSQANGGNLGGVTNGVGNGQILGQIAATGNSPLQFTAPVGTFTPSTGIATTTGLINAAAGQGAPLVQTVGIAMTNGTLAAGVVCVSDVNSFEMVNVTAVSVTSLTASFRKPHLQGALLTQGGTCGWGISPNADNFVTDGTTVRVLLPMLGSTDSSHTYVNTFNNGAYFGGGSAWIYNTLPGVTATYSAATGMVTASGNFGFELKATGGSDFGNVYGQSLAVTGSNDPAYNGTFPVVVTGNNSFTYTPGSIPAASTVTGITVTECNCTFTMYPRAEVLSVYNQTTKLVDGSLGLEPNTVAWATADTVEVPHWHQPDVDDTHDTIQTFTPQAEVYGRGYHYAGNVSGELHGFDLQNDAPMTEYQGYGGWHAAPYTSNFIGGWWNYDYLLADAPATAIFNVGCKPSTTNVRTGSSNNDGCTMWNAAYDIGQFQAATTSAHFQFDPSGNNFAFINNYPCTTTIGSSVGNVGGAAVGGLSITSGGLPANCDLFTTGLVLNGGGVLNGQTGSGNSVVTNTSPSITSAVLNGATLNGGTVPTGQTLTVAGSLNITGGCTGCGSVLVPGTSGQFLMSNGASGFGTAVSSTGSGAVVLASSPTVLGTLTVANLMSNGTMTQNGNVNINSSGSSAPVNINTGGGVVNIGGVGSYNTYGGASIFAANGYANFSGPITLGPAGTATSTANFPSNSYTIKASVWAGGVACNPYVNPYLAATSGTLSYIWNVTGRGYCPGITATAIVDDETQFLDGVKVSHLLSGGPAATVVAGAGAGSGATVNLSNASDLKGVVTVVAGSGGTAGGVMAAVSFGTAYQSAPVCTVSPSSGNAIGIVFSPPATAAGFNLNAGSAISSGATYIFSYTCMD